MGLFNRKKKVKISKEELQMKQMQAQNSLRIVQDCIKLVSETKNPDVFFSRYEILIQHSLNLVSLQPYVTFTGASIVDAYQEALDQRQTATKEFLIRYWSDTLSKMDHLKTEAAKKRKLQTFYDSLERHKVYMNEENIDYYVTKYRLYSK